MLNWYSFAENRRFPAALPFQRTVAKVCIRVAKIHSRRADISDTFAPYERVMYLKTEEQSSTKKKNIMAIAVGIKINYSCKTSGFHGGDWEIPCA
jgi:hypothetical protein